MPDLTRRTQKGRGWPRLRVRRAESTRPRAIHPKSNWRIPFLRKHLAVTFNQTSNLRPGALLFDHGLLNYTATFVTLRIVMAYFRRKAGVGWAELNGGEMESYPCLRGKRVRHVKPSAFFLRLYFCREDKTLRQAALPCNCRVW